jgi:hypothetical protein
MVFERRASQKGVQAKNRRPTKKRATRAGPTSRTASANAGELIFVTHFSSQSHTMLSDSDSDAQSHASHSSEQQESHRQVPANISAPVQKRRGDEVRANTRILNFLFQLL